MYTIDRCRMLCNRGEKSEFSEESFCPAASYAQIFYPESCIQNSSMIEYRQVTEDTIDAEQVLVMRSA